MPQHSISHNYIAQERLERVLNTTASPVNAVASLVSSIASPVNTVARPASKVTSHVNSTCGGTGKACCQGSTEVIIIPIRTFQTRAAAFCARAAHVCTS